MSPAKIVGAFILLGAIAFGLHLLSSRERTTVYDPALKPVEPWSPCPWRDADTDMTNWFPGSTRYQTVDLILSAKRTELREKLGREVKPEEMALHTYVVFSNEIPVGSVMTRRFKGEHGAIELAMALDGDRRVKTLKIQRIREPEETVRALETYGFEQLFKGLSHTNDFVGRLYAADDRSSEHAIPIARKIASETKEMLILLEAGHSDPRLPHH